MYPQIDAFVLDGKHQVIEHGLTRPLLRSEYLPFRLGSAFVVIGDKRQATRHWHAQAELADQPAISCNPARPGSLRP